MSRSEANEKLNKKRETKQKLFATSKVYIFALCCFPFQKNSLHKIRQKPGIRENLQTREKLRIREKLKIFAL